MLLNSVSYLSDIAFLADHREQGRCRQLVYLDILLPTLGCEPLLLQRECLAASPKSVS